MVFIDSGADSWVVKDGVPQKEMIAVSRLRPNGVLSFPSLTARIKLSEVSHCPKLPTTCPI